MHEMIMTVWLTFFQCSNNLMRYGCLNENCSEFLLFPGYTFS